MMDSGIYVIRSPSGGVYVGSAINIEKRWNRHRKDLRANVHGNRPLQRAAQKYGVENLAFSRLLLCAPENLLLYEQSALDGLAPSYNLARIAGSALGIKRTKEFKEKVSNSALGHVVSDETRRKIGAKHKGKKLAPYQLEALAAGRAKNPQSRESLREYAKAMHTPEAKAKKALAMIGRVVAPETRAKISLTLMGHAVSAATRDKIRERAFERSAAKT